MDFDWETKPPYLDIPSKMIVFIYQFELEKIKNEMKAFLKSGHKKVEPQIYWGRVMVVFD